MLPVIFRPTWRQRDCFLIKINFEPMQLADLAQSLSGENQQADDVGEVVAWCWQRIP